MKRLFLSAVTFVLFSVSLGTLQAQTTILRPAVAFVKADRSILYIKQPDSAVQAFDLAAIIDSATFNLAGLDSIRHIGIIGMSSAGDRLIIGADVYYLDPTSDVHVSFEGLVSIPWPVSTFSLTNTLHRLLPSRGNGSFRPVGVLSADGKQWWATMSSASDGDDSLTFYHGNTDGTGTIDSTTYQYEMVSGFHMSNIALDTKNNTMLAMSFDGLQSPDQATDAHVRFYQWTLGNEVEGTEFTGVYRNINTHYLLRTDSLFGLTMIPNNDGTTALMGLTPGYDNTISLYSFPYLSSNFDISSPTTQIPRSIIPQSQNFFAGKNCGAYTEDIAGEDNSQSGNAGDVSVNSIGGDTILFITHESSSSCLDRDANSAIWSYNLNTGQAQFIYNDSSAQELQPVWVVTPYTVPHYPGIAWQNVATTNFGTVDTGKTSSLTFTVVDSSQETPVVVDSANITGTATSEFTITDGKSMATLQPGKTESVTVSFAPIAPAGLKNVTLTVYFEGQNSGGPIQSTITEQLSGTANIPLNGVREDAVLSSSMSIDPNPFSSAASIQLTAPDAGALGIVVHDALGRTVYTSELRETGAGQTQSFTFDAKALGLPNGVYYVTAFLGERQASRAVVFTR